MTIPILDLKAQYEPISEIIIDKIRSIMSRTAFILGSEVEEFEAKLAEYCGCKYAVGVTSGTTALELGLMELDIQPGDEVIVPSFSFFATSEVVSRCNAIPVFADIDESTLNISPDEIRKLITPKTKAIIPVHLYGLPADMDSIMKISEEFNIPIIEDSAQAIGTEYKGKRVCSFGRTACLSFYPGKNLGAMGDGGAILTNDKNIYDKLKLLRAHGESPRYTHHIIGTNSRMDAITAGVLNIKLDHLDKWTEGRRNNAEYYINNLSGKIDPNLFLLPSMCKDYARHVFNQFTIKTKLRDEFQAFLTSKGISSAIHYPVPLPHQPVYKNITKNLSWPVATKASKEVLSLPIYPELTKDQLDLVIKNIIEFFNKR